MHFPLVPHSGTYRTLNQLHIFPSAFVHNYLYLSSLRKEVAIAPVLKSNAYGHGLIEVATSLDGIGAPFFCVDSLHEAYQLLEAKIHTPILIMGYIDPENLKIKRLPFMYAAYGYETLAAVKKYQPQASVHIFVDTGMHREGVSLAELPQFVRRARELLLHVDGIMSHLAMPDEPESRRTKQQMAAFQQAIQIAKDEGVKPKWMHLGASVGLLHTKRGTRIGNIARAGIAIYGIDPVRKITALHPALELTSTVVEVKEIESGEAVGYDFTFTASKKMKLAILPLGYNDGVDVRLSNRGCVSVKGVYCPIVGRVSMNMTTIDVTHVRDISIGEKVVVISHIQSAKNSLSNVCLQLDCSPYELLVHLGKDTKRIVESM